MLNYDKDDDIMDIPYLQTNTKIKNILAELQHANEQFCCKKADIQ